MGDPDGHEPGKPEPPAGLPYVGLGLEIAAALALGVYVGYRLDRWLGTDPWLLVTGALLGMAIGFYGFFKAVLPGREGR